MSGNDKIKKYFEMFRDGVARLTIKVEESEVKDDIALSNVGEEVEQNEDAFVKRDEHGVPLQETERIDEQYNEDIILDKLSMYQRKEREGTMTEDDKWWYSFYKAWVKGSRRALAVIKGIRLSNRYMAAQDEQGRLDQWLSNLADVMYSYVASYVESYYDSMVKTSPVPGVAISEFTDEEIHAEAVKSFIQEMRVTNFMNLPPHFLDNKKFYYELLDRMASTYQDMSVSRDSVNQAFQVYSVMNL
jgi:hypothetical protein